MVGCLSKIRVQMRGGAGLSARLRAPKTLAVIAVSSVAALLIGLQVAAAFQDFEGPLASLARDYIGTPKSMSVPWAGLVLALVGVAARRRVIAVAAAIGIDAVCAALRILDGKPFTVGNGPTIVLTGLVVIALVRWQGRERADALKAAALGALLVLATKVGDVWLHVTSAVRPAVFDEYLLLADHALGDPSWVVGRVLEVLGPEVYGVLHWVYIELPVAAIVVAVWQLRRVVSTGQWPTHYLVRTFLVLGLVGPLFYVLFPVVGPMFAFGADGHGFQVGNFWPSVLPPIGHSPAALPFDAFTTRLIFPTIMVLSVYFFFSGHNAPGGGFAGGLTAGLALTLRYLAGGRYELGEALPVDAGHLLGAGLTLAAGTATASLIFGAPALSSATLTTTLPILDHIKVSTALFFDLGVYLVVVGLVLDVLRSLGARLDKELS